MSDSAIENIVNADSLIIWLTAYFKLFATVLYACCAVLFALFGTNRLIIHWNHVNDHPHGDHPYYLMVAVSAKKQDARAKLKALNVLKHLKDHANHSKKGSGPPSLLKSISMGAQRVKAIFRSQQKGVQPVNEYDDSYYPEILMLDARRPSPMTQMNADFDTIYDEKGSFVFAKEVYDGPLYQAGLMPHDVLLTVNNRFVETLDQYYAIIEDETDMEFVVKRMSRIQGRRGDKIYTCDITKSSQLGLGLGLKSIRSGKTSKKFLYVDELKEYPNGDPGPGLTAGVRQYDLILTINGNPIHTMSDAKHAIQGQQVARCEVRRMIRVARNDHGQAETTQLTVMVSRAPGESLGMSLSEAYAAESAVPFLVVTNVRPGSVGERAGIMVQDLFVQVNGQNVQDLDDLKAAIRGLGKFEITVERYAT